MVYVLSHPTWGDASGVYFKIGETERTAKARAKQEMFYVSLEQAVDAITTAAYKFEPPEERQKQWRRLGMRT